MARSLFKIATLALSTACVLEANAPDTRNLNHCIDDVRAAASHAPAVLTFDDYATNYQQLLDDLQAATYNLPYVYQQAAAEPFIQYLQNLGEDQFFQIFGSRPRDEETATLQQIIPDAALAILAYQTSAAQGINAFEELVSDLYDGFLSDETRVGNQTGRPIEPPNYGSIPPLVKFGNAESGPYTWPGDATSQILGMGCGIVSLPPAQLNGGLIAWSCLGHETGGHDVTHADSGLLDELAEKVHGALLEKFNSQDLADYWARCIDESAADVCGYLNMGPSLGFGLIGYFRALGDGKLRSTGSTQDPHPIDLLRGYLAAAVVKRLSFKEASTWSKAIAAETHKDDATLLLADPSGNQFPFPVSFETALAAVDVVAEVIMQSQLSALQGHSLQELQDWKTEDQAIVDILVSILKTNNALPDDLQGPGFYAAYVVAAGTTAALQKGADIPALFSGMQTVLAKMHTENPTWSQNATEESMEFLKQGLKGVAKARCKQNAHDSIPMVPASH